MPTSFLPESFGTCHALFPSHILGQALWCFLGLSSDVSSSAKAPLMNLCNIFTPPHSHLPPHPVLFPPGDHRCQKSACPFIGFLSRDHKPRVDSDCAWFYPQIYPQHPEQHLAQCVAKRRRSLRT